MPEQYGPDNPRDWDPNHKSLLSPMAPHETAGVLRVHRAGYKGSELIKVLNMRGTQMMNALRRAMDCEGIASSRGVPIHDAVFKK